MGVTFDYAAWSAEFPEFAATVTGAPQATGYFTRATLLCDNSDCSPVTDLVVRAALLNLLTAHIAQLAVGSSVQPVSPIVGRINNATEGSVSVQAQLDYPPGTVQWYQQTRYGAEYWAASSSFRMGMYFPGCVRNEDPYGAFIFTQSP